MKKINNIIILYHKNCFDGFGAAYAAWKKFGDKAVYMPIDHHTPPPKDLRGKKLYMADIAYPAEIMKKLVKICASVTIIDHHVSNGDAIKCVADCLYDVNHSGAVLTWKYFHHQKPVPWLLRHIEDYDIWKFKLSNTKEITAFLDATDFDFKLWDKISRDLENVKKRKKYIETGKVILKYRRKVISKLLGQADKVSFKNHKALAVNSPILQSEIGNLIIEKGYPIGIIWYQKNGRKIFSLRSNKEVDVSEIAQKFGGGGHKAASGFSLDIKKPMPWKYL